MTEEQQFARVFGIISFWVAIVALLSLCNIFRRHVQVLFWRPFHARTEWASPERFSTIDDESGYIPSANILTEMYPLLFCDVTKLPLTMMSWIDPENPDYKPHCAIFDVAGLEKRPCFSTVRYWAPPDLEVQN
jgi:hypothetical protein